MIATTKSNKSHRSSPSGQRGYVLALTALMLIPLMAITAIGVDIGIWFVEASRNQRIADAASLAGAVWMPDEAKAEAVALEAVERNGLTPGVDSTVNIEFVGRSSIRVQVSTASTLAFSGAFLSEFAITRGAVAEYIPPVAVGSPTNQLGQDGLWLAISGECSVRENGDLRSAATLAGYPGASYPPAPCGVGVPNPDYTGEYLMAVTIAVNPGQAVSVQAYDATYAPDPSKTTDIEFRPPSTFDTTFTLYDAPGPPFGIAGHTQLDEVTVSAYDSGWDSNWRTVGEIPNPEPGTYFLRVSTNGSGGSDSFGSNGFALRAFAGSTATACSTLTGSPDYDASCPQVHALEDLPLYASLSGGSSQFYLAEIHGKNAGKQLEITLFDVGEGAERIQILDPDGNPFDFTWQSDCSITAPSPGCSGSATSWVDPLTGTSHAHTLDTSGTGQQIYAATYSQSTWNDRSVVLTVDIPVNYDTAYPGRWWQVRYFFGDDITDRTTWSIRVIGDPVRLTG